MHPLCIVSLNRFIIFVPLSFFCIAANLLETVGDLLLFVCTPCSCSIISIYPRRFGIVVYLLWSNYFLIAPKLYHLFLCLDPRTVLEDVLCVVPIYNELQVILEYLNSPLCREKLVISWRCD